MQFQPEPLFDLCLSAHMCVSGSSDAISDEQLELLLTELKRRRDNWRPSSNYANSLFDDAVFAVVQASISEVEAYFAMEEELSLTASQIGLSRSFPVLTVPVATVPDASVPVITNDQAIQILTQKIVTVLKSQLSVTQICMRIVMPEAKVFACLSSDEQFVKIQDDAEPSQTVWGLKPTQVNEATLYTDGACSNIQSSNRIAGAGAVLLMGDAHTTHKRFLGNVTNQVAELEAAVLGLAAARAAGYTNVHLFSDSQYLVKTMCGEFRKKTNFDIWVKLDIASAGMDVKWEWVRGHNGNRWQEMADRLAVEACK